MPIKKVKKEPQIKGLPFSFALIIAGQIVISLLLLFALLQVNKTIAFGLPIVLTIVTIKLSFKILKTHGSNPIKSIISRSLRKSIRFDDPYIFNKL